MASRVWTGNFFEKLSVGFRCWQNRHLFQFNVRSVFRKKIRDKKLPQTAEPISTLIPKQMASLVGETARFCAKHPLRHNISPRILPRSPAQKPNPYYHRHPLRHLASTPLQQAQTIEQSLPTTTHPLTVELPTADARTALSFTSVRNGRGIAIVVSSVAAGSEAEALGVRPGMQLLTLSDPIQTSEVWQLNKRSSLRYVKQAIDLRRAQFITLSFTPSSTTAVVKGGNEAERVSVGSDDPAPGPASSTSSSSLSSSDAWSTMIVDNNDAATRSTTTGTTTPPPKTIGQRLELRYKQADAGLTDLERRQARRKAYFKQSSGRNDAPFFTAVFAAFILPAAVILGVAASTGYLDTLAAGWGSGSF